MSGASKTSRKKYGAVVLCDADGTWLAQVVRRRTSRGTVVERERKGFDGEEAAQAWASAQLAEYRVQRKERSARRAASRARQRSRRDVAAKYSYRELAERAESERECRVTFEIKAERLWAEIAWRMLKDGASDAEANAEANARVGRTHRERLANAKSGVLDTVAFGANQMAVANARFILELATGSRSDPSDST